MAQPLKIFISSPGDVSDERRRAALVISRLKREFARFFDLSAVLWEYEPMLSSGHFQDVIDPPSSADIVVLILWSRLGTPLPAKTDTREYKGLDGRVPVTGTEWEYEQALEARQTRGGVPDLLVYRKLAEGLASFSRIEQLDQVRQQWEALQGFWQRYFETPDGRFKAAFNRFTSLDEFESQLEQHLRELLRRRLPAQPLRVEAKPGDRLEWWSGSPYRGLQAFDLEHAAVFFGRERAQREITEALVHRASEGSAFMLVLGASGSGKSSLVRAGIVPDLMAPGVVSGVSTWRHVVVQPGDLAPDPCAALTALLIRSKALPELAAVGFAETEVAAQLRGDPALAAVPLRQALQRAAADDPHAVPSATRKGQLILVLDQMETMFTSVAFNDQTRQDLDTLLAKLVHSGQVWLVATLRSDFYHRLVELPQLNALASGTGQYQLAAPSAVEIEQIVRGPAEAAGLLFELDDKTGIRLDAVIRETSARDPASLPLLSFVLDELYHRDVEGGRGNILTYDSYRTLGELEGAIAHHADQLVEGLPSELNAALPSLLLSLVEIDQIKGTATARTVRRSSLSGPQQNELADKLVAARLAVADDPGTGETLRVAHEALLTRWPLFAKLIDEHRDFLIVRRRLQGDAANWQGSGGDADLLLPAGRRLAEAEDVLSKRRADLDPEIVVYAEASIAAERDRVEAAQRAKEAALRRELQRSRRIAAVVSVLLLLAVAAGGYAWRERTVATDALVEAERDYQLALDQAAGNVQLLTDSYEDGAVSTDLMRQLMEKSQKTINGLTGESEDVTAARIKLLDVLSLANTALANAGNAQTFAEQATALADGLKNKTPADPQILALWARSHGQLADALFWKGDSNGALAQARTATDTAEKLVAANPGNQNLQRDLMADYQRVGDALRSLGDLTAAADTQRTWVAHVQTLVQQNPDDARLATGLINAQIELGDTLEQSGKPADAIVSYQAAKAVATTLTAKDPKNFGYAELLSEGRERVGDALLAQKASAAAMVEYRAALELAVKVSGSDSANFLWREVLEAMHERVGEVLRQGKNYTEALQEFRTYLTLTEETLAKAPDNGSAGYDVANAHEKVGDVLREQGDLGGALQEYQQSAKIATDLTGKNWWNAGWQKMLAMAYQRVGMVLSAQGDTNGALAQFKQCAAVPVNNFTWSPRLLWPSDVLKYCQDEIAQLDHPH